MTTLRRRLDLVARHAVQRLLPVAIGLSVSLLVVRRHGAAAWGAWVEVALALQLVALVVGWGNRDDVLRRLARDGAPVGPTVRAHLGARLRGLGAPALVAVLAIAWFGGWSPGLLLVGSAWLLLRVVAQSAEAALVHEQAFLRGGAADALAAVAPLAGVLAAGLPDAPAEARLALAGWMTLGEAARVTTLALAVPQLRADARAGGEPGSSGVEETGDPSVRHRASVGFDTRSVLRAGLPFFLVGAAGMLASRVDLYCVALLLDDAEVARYQVVINGLIWLQAIAGLLLTPFARELYRADYPSLLKLTRRFSGLGLLVAMPGSAAVMALVHLGYQLPVSWALGLTGVVYVAQMFVQVPAIYALYKAGRERVVLRMSTAIVLANAPLNLALIPSLGIEGALAASALVGAAAAAVYLRVATRLALDPGAR